MATQKELAIRLAEAHESLMTWYLDFCNRKERKLPVEKDEYEALTNAERKLLMAGKYLAHDVAYGDGTTNLQWKLEEFSEIFKKYHAADAA